MRNTTERSVGQLSRAGPSGGQDRGSFLLEQVQSERMARGGN